MRAVPLLLGCLLGLGAIANATAAGTTAAGSMGAASGTSYNCNQHAAEHSFNIPRGASGSSSAPGNIRPSGSSTSGDAPSHMDGGESSGSGSSRSSGLGWQSLLPGSIQ
jgi:hypothetical protein